MFLGVSENATSIPFASLFVMCHINDTEYSIQQSQSYAQHFFYAALSSLLLIVRLRCRTSSYISIYMYSSSNMILDPQRCPHFGHSLNHFIPYHNFFVETMELDKIVINWAGDDVGNVDTFNVQSLAGSHQPILSPPGIEGVPTNVPTVELSCPSRRITRQTTLRHDLALKNDRSIFFTLPLELRHRVYALACNVEEFAPSVHIHETLDQYMKSKSWRLVYYPQRNIDLRFLRTCRAMFMEARHMPLATNRCSFTHHMARSDLQMFTFPIYNHHVRDLNLQIRIWDGNDERNWPPLLRQVMKSLNCLDRLSIKLELIFAHMKYQRKFPSLKNSSGMKVYRESTDIFAVVAFGHGSLRKENVLIQTDLYGWIRYTKYEVDDHTYSMQALVRRHFIMLKFEGNEDDYDQWYKDHEIKDKGWFRPDSETLAQLQNWLNAVKMRMFEFP